MNWCGIWYFFKKVEPFYPWILMAVIIVIVFLIVFLLFSYFFKAKEPKSPKIITDGPSSPNKSTDHSLDLPPYVLGLSEFITVFKRGDFAQSIFSAHRFLKEKFMGQDYKYVLPWFVLLGPEGSGKTKIAKHLESCIGAAVPDFPQLFPRQNCTYSFFSNAVLCNLAGRFFMHAKNNDNDNAGFRTFLTLFSRYRQKTPLNGIVLTIPVTELQSVDKKTIIERAKLYHTQLGALQNYLNIRVPIYVMITQIDLLPGFKQFADHLPQDFKQAILGWSAPYDTNTAYTTKWCEDAFDHIDQHLKKLIFELSTYTSGWDENGGLYIFWKELVQLKDNMKIYCDQIFTSHIYANQPWLRGIYFTGVSDGDLLFTQKLFEQKIFKEGGLVSPIRGLITTHHARYLQYGLLGLMLWFGIFGAKAVWRFQQQRDEVLPIVFKMNQLFDRMQNTLVTDETEMGRIYEDAIQQLSLLSQVNKNKLFFSWAVPVTWVSPFRKNVNHTLHRTAQLILIRSLYYALMLKVKDLIHLRPTKDDASQNLGQLLVPESSPEYKLVERFTSGLKSLQDHVDKFNQMKNYHDPKVLDDLMKYVFNTRLPEHVYHQYTQIEPFLFNRLFPPIDLNAYAKPLHTTMGILYQNLYNALFDPHTLGSLPYRLNQLSQQLSPDKKETPDLSLFKTTQDSLNTVKALLGKEGKTWLDHPNFAPSEAFNNLWKTIDGIGVLGRPVSQMLIDQTGLGFGNLQRNMQDLHQEFAGGGDGEAKEFDAQKTSQLIFTLGKELDKIFSQSYMQTPLAKPVDVTTKKTEVFSIQPEAFKPIASALSQEEKFTDQDIAKMPAGSQKKLRSLASEGVTNFVRYQLNQNQKNINQLSPDATDSEREALLDSVKMFDQPAQLVKIIEAMPSKEGVDIRDGLNKTAQYLLKEAGTLLSNGGAYMPRDLNNMLWWDGFGGAGLQAYGAIDQGSLNLSMRHQFDRVKKLAQKVAPLIEYLKTHVAEADDLDHALIDKWDTITQAVKDKEAKKGSSLTDLEKFITDDMNGITYLNAAEKIPLSDVVGQSHDYFIQVKKRIQQALLARAEIISRTNAIKAYNCITNFFNKNIAGKFPFTDQLSEVDDLALEDLWDFFALYDQKGGSPEKILANVYELGGFDEHIKFLKNIHEIRTLFDHWIQGKSETKFPVFDIEIEFRVNRKQEQNGQFLHHLWFEPSSTQHIKHLSGLPMIGTWRYGEPMEVGFEWASPSPSAPVPVADGNRKYLRVDRLRATMRFGGNWALFSLLRRLQTSDTEIQRYLRLVIPQSNGLTTVLYHKVGVLKPAKNSKDPKKVYLKIPVFPFYSPPLPCMKDYLIQALLLEKRMNCVSKKDDPSCTLFADADANSLSCAVTKKDEQMVDNTEKEQE